MDKRAINSPQDFHNAEGRLALGDSMRIEYQRNGKTRKTNLEIQSVPVLMGGDLDKRLEGARFTELSVKHKQQNMSGVLIDDLQERSRLAREGLAEGDIIVGINRERVRNLEDFSEGLEKTRGSILLQISRRGRSYVARID